MPEMRFEIEWPDGSSEICYSPSLVVKEYFAPGEAYPLDEFLQRGRTALEIASQRVRAKFGTPCGLALAQLARLEAGAAKYRGLPAARVAVLAFHE